MMRVAPAVGIVALLCVPLAGQSTPAAKFDVADVRPSVPPEDGPPAASLNARIGVPRNGRYEIRRATMVDLIRTAYGVEADKVVGGPPWLEMNRFDIVAKVPSSASRETVMPMLQKLLIDRLNLKVRWEEREVKGYSLVADGKHKLVKSDPASRTRCTSASATASSSSASSGVASIVGITQAMTCQNMTMGEFAAQLQRTAGSYFQVPVLDETGLEGRWNFTIRFSPPGLAQTLASLRAATGAAQAAPGGGGTASDPTGEMTIEEAVDRQMGLKLRSRQRAGRVLVVDYVADKPTSNN